jgi:hypothetical protein
MGFDPIVIRLLVPEDHRAEAQQAGGGVVHVGNILLEPSGGARLAEIGSPGRREKY